VIRENRKLPAEPARLNPDVSHGPCGWLTAASRLPSSMNSPIGWWAGADGSTSGLLVLRTGLRRISSPQAQMGTTK
jgi:hypothetical protein